jgi:ribosomal protein S21
MLIIKVEKGNLERALKMYKSKVIKTRQMSELNERKTFIKDSVKNREMMKNAKYVQQKYKSNKD